MTRHIIDMWCFHWIPTRVGQFGAGVPPLPSTTWIGVVSILLYWQKSASLAVFSRCCKGCGQTVCADCAEGPWMDLLLRYRRAVSADVPFGCERRPEAPGRPLYTLQQERPGIWGEQDRSTPALSPLPHRFHREVQQLRNPNFRDAQVCTGRNRKGPVFIASRNRLYFAPASARSS